MEIMATSHRKIRYVEDHHNGYRYCRVVPPDVRPMLPRRKNGKVRRSWIRTWPGGTSWDLIQHEAGELARHHDSIIRRVRAGELIDPEAIATAERNAQGLLSLKRAEMYELMALVGADGWMAPDVRATVNAVEHGGRYTPETLTVRAAYDRDRERYEGTRDERPLRYAVDTFTALVGDKDVRAVTRADAESWIDSMRKRKNSPATIRRRLGAMRAMVNRAFLAMDHEGRNPFARHKLPERTTGGRRSDRLPFNRAMLDKIDEYLNASRRVHHETRNLLTLMRYTGCGPAEIGGVVLADVSLESAPAVLNEKGEVVRPEVVPYFWVRANAVRGLKTNERRRQVPLVGDALVAATDAVKRARVRSKGMSPDEVPVFTGFGKGGRGADYLSDKLNMAIRRAGIPESRRLTVYSFRHTMKQALRRARVADHVQRRVLGHAGHGVADDYGSDLELLEEVRDAVTDAVAELGNVSEDIYSSKERV